MASVSLGVSAARFEEVSRLLSGIKGGVGKAVSRALNRAMERSRTNAAELVASRYTVKKSDFRRNLKLIRATPGNLTARMITTAPRSPISRFRHNPQTPPPQKGIPVRLRRKVSTEVISGRSKTWSHAFLAQMGNGHVGIYVRNRRTRVISEVQSLSDPQMLNYSGIMSHVLEGARNVLDDELRRQVLLFLRGDAR